MNTTTEEKSVLKLQRTFAAPRERVFAAWTDPEQARQWFGGEGCEVRDLQMDLRVGGEYRIFVDGRHGEMVVRGVYREITPPAKLVYTWQWEDDPNYVDHDTLVTVEFTDLGGSTEIRLTHENFPTEESRGNHEYGWTGTFDKLARHLNS